MFRVISCLSCLSAVGEIGLAQQAPPSYYPPRKPSLLQRIEQTGENVGSFIRRKFYGEPAPGAYQQPVYRRPGGAPVAYRAPVHNLDAPARPAYQTSGTGYQRPVASTVPKYVKPPLETSTEDAIPETKPVAKTTSKTTAKPATSTTTKPKTSTTTKPKASTTTAKTKPTPPSEPDAAPKTTTKKRYTPAKPSTFTKPEPKPAPVRKTVEDQPPETRSSPTFPASTPEPPRYNPSSTGTTQASLKTERTSLSGGLDSAPTTTTTALSPTIGGSEVDLTPKDTEPAETSSLPKVSTTSQSSGTGTTTDVGSKSSGSFLVGKKGSKPGRVVSPYAPFNELDVTGLPTGSLALDPTTQKVFEVP